MCIHIRREYLTKWGVAKLPSVTAIFNDLGRARSSQAEEAIALSCKVLAVSWAAPQQMPMNRCSGETRGKLQQGRASGPSRAA